MIIETEKKNILNKNHLNLMIKIQPKYYFITAVILSILLYCFIN